MPIRRDPRARFRWNSGAQQYIDGTGRFVPRAAVRRALDAAIQAEGEIMVGLFRGLQSGALSLDGWALEMRTSLKNIHLWSAAAAKGGWAQLDASDYGRVGRLVLTQYQRLERFAVQLAAGLPLDGRALRRVIMYAQSGRRTFHEIQQLAMQRAGFTEERNVLDPAAEHCTECVQLSQRGWVPLGTLPKVGARQCLTACRCYLIYRKS